MDQLIIFQQAGSGTAKIAGLRQYGRDITIKEVYDLPVNLPDFIENPEDFITDSFKGDLVLSFLKHPDLIDHLIRLCTDKDIPIIAAGIQRPGAISPFTCCGLGRLAGLGQYGEQFGIPEYRVRVNQDRIKSIEVLRGASCGATWQACAKVIGLSREQALETIAREVQYLCVADPSNFDPVTGKSALHFAGKVHHKALAKALNSPSHA